MENKMNSLLKFKITKAIPPIIILLSSCFSIKKTVRESYRYEMYIDFKNISFQGQNRTQQLYLEIDSVDGMWYTGKLIIDHKDTIRLKGFEKGSHYVTSYQKTGSNQNGGLKIWCSGNNGQIRDSLTIEEHGNANVIIDERTVLYRQPRKSCQ